MKPWGVSRPRSTFFPPTSSGGNRERLDRLAYNASDIRSYIPYFSVYLYLLLSTYVFEPARRRVRRSPAIAAFLPAALPA